MRKTFMKKPLALSLALVLLALPMQAFAAQPTGPPFMDVASNDWYKEAVAHNDVP